MDDVRLGPGEGTNEVEMASTHDSINPVYHEEGEDQQVMSSRDQIREMAQTETALSFNNAIAETSVEGSSSAHGQNDPFPGDHSKRLCEQPRSVANSSPEKKSCGRQYSCRVCGKAFAKICYLNAHVITHNSDRPFPCSLCGKAFKTSGGRNRHVKIHSAVRPYSCNICGRSFKDNGNINSHKTTHTEDRPFRCEICGSLFKTKASKSRHLKKHMSNDLSDSTTTFRSSEQKFNEKSHVRNPFSCTVCGKTFKSTKYRTTHMRAHSGDRPNSCSFGSKSYVPSNVTLSLITL